MTTRQKKRATDDAAPGTHTIHKSGNLQAITPFFIARDLQTSVAHYVERFGFQLDFEGPPDDVYYARVSREGVGIMLKVITPEVLPSPNNTRHEWARWDAFVYTMNPDVLYHEFKARGATFVKDLSFIDDGLWGFEVTDADGYVLAFFCTRPTLFGSLSGTSSIRRPASASSQPVTTR